MSCTKIDPVKQGHKTNKRPVRRKTWRKGRERERERERDKERERERERESEGERESEREAQHRRRNLLHKKGSFSGFGRFSSLPFEASLQFLSRLTTRFNFKKFRLALKTLFQKSLICFFAFTPWPPTWRDSNPRTFFFSGSWVRFLSPARYLLC